MEATPLRQQNKRTKEDGHSRGKPHVVQRNSLLHLQPFRGFAIIVVTAHYDNFDVGESPGPLIKKKESQPSPDDPLSCLINLVEKRFPSLSLTISNETNHVLTVRDPNYILSSQKFQSLASKTGYFGTNEIGFRTYDVDGPSPTVTSKNTILVDLKSGRHRHRSLTRQELYLLAAPSDTDLHARWDNMSYEIFRRENGNHGRTAHAVRHLSGSFRTNQVFKETFDT